MQYADYSKLTKRFNNDLVDKLRGHGEDDEVLSLWVPNENIISSLSNFLAALKETNQKQYFLKIEESLITQFEIDQLSKSQIGSFKITCEYVKNYFYLDIVNLNKNMESLSKLDDWKAKEIVRKVDYKYGASYIELASLRSFSVTPLISQEIADTYIGTFASTKILKCSLSFPVPKPTKLSKTGFLIKLTASAFKKT